MARQVVLMGEARQRNWIPEPIACLLQLLGSAPGIRQRAYVTLGNLLTLSKSQLLPWKMRIIVSSRACPMNVWTAFQGHLNLIPRRGTDASPPPSGEHWLHKGVLPEQTGECRGGREDHGKGQAPWEEKENSESWREGGNMALPYFLQTYRVRGVWAGLRAPAQRGRHEPLTWALFTRDRISCPGWLLSALLDVCF